MVLGGRKISFLLCMLGAFGELLGALAGFRLGAVARGRLLPVVDLLLRRSLGGVVACRGEAELFPLGRRLHYGAADAFRLEECPEVRRLDVLADRFGLRPLA